MAFMLMEGGYKTALYTSPHLLHAGERLLINGAPLPAERWMKAADAVEAAIKGTEVLRLNPPTYFEIFTAAAFLLIAEEQVQAAVIETGMGGRFDATNLLKDCRLAIITPIGMDHMEFLGGTIEEIASEKFGIIHSGDRALFIGGGPKLNEQFRSVCSEVGAFGSVFEEDCELTTLESSLNGNLFRLRTPDGTALWNEPLLGVHQPQNGALALRAMELLQGDFPCSQEARSRGMAKTQWPGRLELISENPLVLIDGAHNPHGMEALARSLKALLAEDRPLTVVYATMSDKNYMESLEILHNTGRQIRLVCTEVPHNHRSEIASKLAEKASSISWSFPPQSFDNPFSATEIALSFGDPLLFCGSLYFIALVRRNLIERFQS